MWILNLEPKSNNQKALIFQGIFTFYILKGRFNMFGKKKKTNAIRVMHYEGIAQFATDYPCTIELKDDVLEIIRIKPETTVTLPKDRINNIMVLEEANFMSKYHGHADTTAKAGKKTYLVIEYDKGMLAFWGAGFEAVKLWDIAKEFSSAAPSNISL